MRADRVRRVDPVDVERRNVQNRPTKPARATWIVLSTLALGLFTVGTNAFIIAGLLADIAADFSTTSGQASYAVTFYAAAVGIAAPLIAIFLPHVSRTGLMSSGLVVAAIGGIIAAGSTSMVTFIIGRVVAGIGGAALVPAAIAAAAAIVPPERRGRALAFVSMGFSMAAALGAPIGTAIGASGGWQLPLYLTSGIALITALAIALLVRAVPREAVVRVRARFAPLRNGKLLAALGANILITAGFNAVYIFSSVIMVRATGGDGKLLAILLLSYGVAGMAGNALGGPSTDRFGNRRTATVALSGQLIVFLLIPVFTGSFIGSAILFSIWGLLALGSVIPIQHRVLLIAPETSGIAISWFSTSMYVGIALAPTLGSFTEKNLGANLIPLVAAGAMALALALFQFAYGTRRRS